MGLPKPLCISNLRDISLRLQEFPSVEHLLPPDGIHVYEVDLRNYREELLPCLTG